MSRSGTEMMGDLHDIPDYAPEGLKALFSVAEGIIHSQIELLGTGDPPEAPQQVFREAGITDPENQGTMVDNYRDHKAKVTGMRSEFEARDNGVQVRTTGIGEVLTNAYEAIRTSVRDLNTKIDDAHSTDHIRTVTDDEGNTTNYLADYMVSQLFDGVWATLNTVYEEVSGVSDQVTAQARDINGPTHPRSISPAATGPLLPSVAPNSPASSAANAGVEYVATATDADYAAYTGSKDVKSAIDGALDALGIHDPEARENWTRGYLVLIERESGGDPNAINNWDSNAASGQHSRGLCQMIPATFESYHVAGTSSNIYDPVANVAASMNYVMDRYDVAKDGSNLRSAVQQTNPAATPKGY